MDHQHLAVGGLLNVELDEVGSLLDGEAERGERVLGRRRDAPRCAITATGWLRRDMPRLRSATAMTASAAMAATPTLTLTGTTTGAPGRAQAGVSRNRGARGSPMRR